MTKFSDHLRESREQAGLSQSRLAAIAGYDHSYVSRLESDNRSPTRDAVLNLAAAMGCDDGETDSLLMAAEFLPNNPENLFRKEPVLWEVYTLLASGVLPRDVQNDVRAALGVVIRQARRAGIGWIEAT